MPNCCSASGGATAMPIAFCPVSGAKGSLVERETLKALLTSEAASSLSDAPHRFCSDPECPVVYFAENGLTYSTADIRVKVWQKEPIGARVVCYCFGENESDIRSEIERCGTSDAVTRVREQIRAGRCACEERNPRGVCCLGEVAAAVTRLKALTGEQGEWGKEWASTPRIKSASLQPEVG